MGRLTRTPYLVMFVLLGAIGVTTAYGITTITLAGDVSITDGGTLSIGIDNAGDDDIIKFDDGSQEFFWDESQNRFQVGDALQIEGPFISSFGDPANVGYSRIGSSTSNHGLNGINDFLVTDMLEVNGKTFLDNDLTITTGDIICTDCVDSADLAPDSVGLSEIKANAVGGSEVVGTSQLVFGTCMAVNVQLAPGDVVNKSCVDNNLSTTDEVVATLNFPADLCYDVTQIRISETQQTTSILFTIRNVCQSGVAPAIADIPIAYIAFNV